MLNSQYKNVYYTSNDWRNVTRTYKLQNSFEVTIHDNMPTNTINTGGSSHHWLVRTALIATVISLFGNLPVQSKLLRSNPGLDISNKSAFQLEAKDLNNNSSGTLPSHYLADTDTVRKSRNSKAIERTYPQELTLPPRAIKTYTGHTQEAATSKWKTYKVKSYDNLTNIFYKLGHQSMLKTLQKDQSIYKELKKLDKGTVVRAASDTDGKLSELVFSRDNVNTYVLTHKKDNKFVGSWQKGIFEVRQSRSSFTIRNGLFFDGKKAGISNNIIKQVVKVFDWDIDFSHDIRVGDKVTLVFEEVYHDGDKVRDQNLLAAEFINKGREFRTIRYTYADGKSDYFTPEGREMKKAFIRTPIAHARVSSHFNPGRFHPKLHKIRAHKGTDFAARTGTPIMATGNGIITSIGRKGGYGRVIEIKHREGYSTVYAHMSRYNKKLKRGSKVYQGDIIGYVGQSGLATGPHLHYEFRKNGKAVDSMRVALPNSLSLTSAELQDFRNKAINLVLQLNVLNRFAKAKIEINNAFGG